LAGGTELTPLPDDDDRYERGRRLLSQIHGTQDEAAVAAMNGVAALRAALERQAQEAKA
jgi:hypothetical protein